MYAAWILAVALAAAFQPDGGEGGDQHDVRLRARPADEVVLVAPTIDELAGGDVLRVRVERGTPGATGEVRQCERAVGDFQACYNAFPVLFDDDGRAVFQYQVHDRGACGPTETCVVVVTEDDDGPVAFAFTVFGAPAPPAPSVAVTPDGPYEPGDEVRVEVRSLPPGTRIEAAFCAPACGETRSATAGADGRAAVDVVIGDRCRGCTIAVVGGPRGTRVPVRFAAEATAGYDAPRLVAGLMAAVVFMLLAWRIVATVDWRPPSEAATPEMDTADPT